MDAQLSIIHQGAGQAREVKVVGEVNPSSKAHLRRGRGREGGAGGGGGAGLTLLCSGLFHGHHCQAPPLQLDSDISWGVTTGVESDQKVSVAFSALQL